MYTLGINAAFHDSAAALIKDGALIAAAEEPIVCSPKDAIACFFASPFDALVINSFLLEKM